MDSTPLPALSNAEGQENYTVKSVVIESIGFTRKMYPCFPLFSRVFL